MTTATMTRPRTVDDLFEDWKRDNDHIVVELERLITNQLDSGRTRFSLGRVVEELRWESSVQSNNDPFKLNDKYIGRLARYIIERNPQWDGIFELRKLRSR